MNISFFLENAWRWKCGLPDIEYSNIPSLDSLKETEWDDEFEQLMRNRLIMGAIRYGVIRGKNKPKYDRIKSMIKRLNKYNESGNKEYLVDVANLCLLEFVECHHPKAFFHAIDENDHVNKI